MKTDVTQKLVQEHRLILRMLNLLEAKAGELAADGEKDYRFFVDGVDFIRNYADRYHHAKEEDVLFEALVENGMPRANSPVAAMLAEHEMGRAYVKGLEEAATRAQSGERGQDEAIVANARGYLALLRDHISKEDGILYPLAERVIPEEKRQGIVEGYRAAAENAASGLEEHYRRIVEGYEAKKAA